MRWKVREIMMGECAFLPKVSHATSLVNTEMGKATIESLI